MSERRHPFGFAWSPPEAGYLGAILLVQWPIERLTAPTYWNALAERINRLVAQEDDDWRRRLLEAVRVNEPWVDDRQTATIGSVLVEASEWLRDRVHFPRDGVPAAELRHQPETYESLIDDRLEAYVAELYCPAR